ncbi:aldehyde dehydrogenase family protein [Patulibacter defluvii]|uniref:aldehyde dehydrogenase family protein n=1 Tax=Patulibacter defluvii TaxID=3095358 RepID=UPI002A766B94|nr:aldehyde dehydrogenase family protein [Patulibacter sp. DM4]
MPEPVVTALPTATDLVADHVGRPSLVIGAAEDPSSGAPVGELRASDVARVDAALAAAARGWDHGAGGWSGRGLDDRLRALGRLGDALDRRVERLAEAHAREIGIPIATARGFAAGLSGVVAGVAATARRELPARPLSDGDRRVALHRLPWGPAALLAPWNAGAFVAVTKLANALAAGCPAILKPSERDGATTAILIEALVEADLGPDAVQVVCGAAAVGAQLVTDERIAVIAYTGSTAGGRAVARASIDRMPALQLELSGSNPALVLPGADLDAVAAELARGALVLNGQWCEAPRRVLVPRADHDRLAERLLAELTRRRIGPATDPATELGPLAFRGHHAQVVAQLAALAERGTAVAVDAPLPEGGFFLAPTVVGELPLDAVREELFGPVLALQPYAEVEQALAAANGLGDGLAGYVFGPDRDAALAIGRRLHAGEVRVGGVRVLDLAPGSSQSFWGSSGLGGHGDATVLGAYVGTRIVGEEDPALPL